jgi:hypothetical protein
MRAERLWATLLFLLSLAALLTFIVSRKPPVMNPGGRTQVACPSGIAPMQYGGSADSCVTSPP